MALEKEERCEKIYTHCRWFKDNDSDEIGVLFCNFGLMYLGLYSDKNGGIYEGAEAQIVHDNKIYTLICDDDLTRGGWVRIAKKWAMQVWTS